MSMIHSILLYPVGGFPLWMVAVGFVALAIVDALVKRSKNTRAESLLQFACVKLAESRLAAIPLFGDLVKAIAAGAPLTAPGAASDLIEKQPGAGQSLRLLVLLVGLGYVLSACTIAQAARSVADAATLAQSTGVVIDGLNETKDAALIAECRAETTPKCVKARADLEAWKTTRSKARAALAAFRSVLLGTQATLLVAQQASSGTVDVAGAVANLSAATAVMTKALADLGITGGGGQ